MNWFKKSEDPEMELQETDEEGQLALDVYQDKDNIVIKSTVAGVKPEDVDISISDNTVSIRGERKREEEVSDKDYFYQECYWGGFSRTLELPTSVDADRADADIKDGILTIVLPKLSGTRTKKVRVKGEV